MSKNVALLFPGQGSQYVGMGSKLATNNFKNADATLGYSLSKIMFEGPMEELTLTKNTQPAIVTHSVSLYESITPLLIKRGAKITHVLGHSVGEYSALVAAGVLSLADATLAVHMRGTFMQEAVAPGVGKMFACLRVSADLVKEACLAATEPDSKVQPANFNDPEQTVISGEANACARAVKYLEEKSGGKARAMELKVSAPFHSSYMEPAAAKLRNVFEKLTFNKSRLPYIANVNATEYAIGTDGQVVLNNLLTQVAGAVLWVDSIKKIPAGTLCIECGPGKILAGLVKKINPELKVISLDNETALSELEGAL